jgi:hypothetical protein
MYKKMVGWADSTQAYFAPNIYTSITGGCARITEKMELDNPTCIHSGYENFFIDSHMFTDHAVCELPVPSNNKTTQAGIPLSRNMSSIVVGLTICPTYGHVTHAFLTCDPESGCGAEW